MKSIADSKFSNRIAKAQEFVVFLLLVIIPLLVFTQVILRYVLKIPLMGIEEIMLFPIIWLYMLGGGIASRERDHIQAGIITLYIKKERTLAIFFLVRTVVSLLISLWLTWWALDYFLYSLRIWKLTPLLYLPLFAGESAMFIGLLSMSYFTFVELIDRWLEVKRTSGK